MIKRYNDVVQTDSKRWHVEFVNTCRRYTFKPGTQFVSEQAGPTALERRKISSQFLWQPLKLCCQNIECTGCGRRNVKPLNRICRNKRIATQIRVAHGAVEENHMRQASEAEKNFNSIEGEVERLD